MRALAFYFGPDLLCLAVFALALGALLLVHPASFSFVHASILMPLGILFGLLAIAFGVRARSLLTGGARERREFARLALGMVRDWCPLVLIVLVYENFHDLTHLLRPDVVDGWLRRLDETLFSVEPSLWLQRFTRPWLTELMTAAYALYFVYPAALLGLLYARGRFLAFRELGLALSIAFYLGLVGYMLVPAVGPRYAFAAEFHIPLQGPWLTAPAAAAWKAIESIERDCFPSLHTALTTIALIHCWRYRRDLPRGRALFALFLPLIVALWASTLYLRYHYAVDVLAGWALALLAAQAAPRLVRWYYARRYAAEPRRLRTGRSLARN